MPLRSSHSYCLVYFWSFDINVLIILHITEFVVIHNGIITNYKEIKTYLVSCLGVFFCKTATDC